MLQKLFLTTLAVLGISNTGANHIMGSDTRFISLGNGKYEVVLKLYRDCRGDSINGNYDSVTFYAGNNGALDVLIQKIKLTRIVISDVTHRCNSSSNPCDPLNTSAQGKGVEEHIYTAQFDLGQAPFSTAGLGNTYCELTATFETCCRHSAITNGAADLNFVTRSTLNICNLSRCISTKNSTVEFAAIPIVTAYLNMPLFYHPQAIDTVDFDSLAYMLVPALRALPATAISYTSPLTYKIPMTPYCVTPGTVNCTPNTKTNPPRGFYFDSSSGQVIATPVSADETDVFSVLVSEFRKDSTGGWVLVSSVRREQEFLVENAGYNYPPVITGPTLNEVCEGDKICFDISSTDQTFTPFQTVPDTILLNWNRGIPGATFVVKNPTEREKTGQFCWQTRVGDASDIAYSFTVTAWDNHCPKPAYHIRGFKVKVNAKAYDQRTYRCMDTGLVSMSAKLPESFKYPASFKWSVRDSNGFNESFFATVKDTFAPIPYFGKFIILHTVNNGKNCPSIYRDTVTCYDYLNNLEPISGTAVTVYPNPVEAGNSLMIEGMGKGRFELLDPIGRVIANGEFDGKITVPEHTIPGVYYLRISKEETIYFRILVSR